MPDQEMSVAHFSYPSAWLPAIQRAAAARGVSLADVWRSVMFDFLQSEEKGD